MNSERTPLRRRLARIGAPGRLLAGMRIRKKLLVLHTCFSLVLAAVLVLTLRPAILHIVEESEFFQASVLVSAALRDGAGEPPSKGAENDGRDASPRTVPLPLAEDSLAAAAKGAIAIWRGSASDIGLDAVSAQALRSQSSESRVPQQVGLSPAYTAAGIHDPKTDQFVVAAVRLSAARAGVVQLYIIVTIALLAIYGLVVVALEVLVLPQHVYGPIQKMLEAERAVQDGRREDELIHEAAIPADELGDIMRWRNESILSIRRHERDLAVANRQLEQIAVDLKRKNHLIEMAQRNLADADRLAGLGIMSAGLAHELNTPLAVLKGLVEKIGAARSPGVTEVEAQLMLRVVRRLERLSESLLDLARIREMRRERIDLRQLVDEAWTLVRLDRDGRGVALINAVADNEFIWCDGDRIMQVMINLIRNAVDAFAGSAHSARLPAADPASPSGPAIHVECRPAAPEGEFPQLTHEQNDDGGWLSITISDNGPGIEPQILDRLFEPFVSTRLDSKGTGLGLAVSEGIVREHGGLILARNKESGGGAVFEVLLPRRVPPAAAAPVN